MLLQHQADEPRKIQEQLKVGVCQEGVAGSRSPGGGCREEFPVRRFSGREIPGGRMPGGGFPLGGCREAVFREGVAGRRFSGRRSPRFKIRVTAPATRFCPRPLQLFIADGRLSACQVL